jgi:hypothetical protein
MRGRAMRSNGRRGTGRGEDVGAVEAGAVVIVALEGVVGRMCWWRWRWHCFGGTDGVSGDACASAWPS